LAGLRTYELVVAFHVLFSEVASEHVLFLEVLCKTKKLIILGRF
jgi:hypothetical protein